MKKMWLVYFMLASCFLHEATSFFHFCCIDEKFLKNFPKINSIENFLLLIKCRNENEQQRVGKELSTKPVISLSEVGNKHSASSYLHFKLELNKNNKNITNEDINYVFTAHNLYDLQLFLYNIFNNPFDNAILLITQSSKTKKFKQFLRKRFGIICFSTCVDNPIDNSEDIFPKNFEDDVRSGSKLMQVLDKKEGDKVKNEEFNGEPLEENRTVEEDDFDDPNNGFNGRELPVSLFIRVPTMVKPIPKSLQENKIYKILEKYDGYGGLDGMVLANLAEYLNFKPVINIPPPNAEYGYLERNGTFMGSLGDVIYGNVIISMNGRFINDYQTDKIDFLTPVSNDMLCIIVPSAEKVPQWLKIFRCFSIWSWVSIFGAYWITTIFWYNLKAINFKNKKSKNCFAAFEMYTFFVSASVKLPSLDSHRLFFASCMFFNIIITGIFQGSLFRSYTTTSFFPNINTLKTFDESGLRIGTASQNLAETFVGDTKLGKSLRNKVVVNPGTSFMYRAAHQRDFAALERSADAKMRIKANFTRPDGFELLHVVKECPRSYHVAYIVSKGSPYLPVFNKAITTFKESGLLSKWNSDTTNAFIRESRSEKKFEGEKMRVFTFDDMQTAFYLLAIGLIFSSIVFLIELKC